MDTRPRSGWIFYDGDCTVCLELAARFGGLLHGAGFELVPFQHPWAVATLDLASGEIPDAARVVTTDGASSAGVDAMLFLAGCFWWAKPVAWLGRWPAAMRWMRRGYAWFAARRHCIGGVCGLPRPGQRPAEASTLNQRREAQ